jgi:hypothetical protein
LGNDYLDEQVNGLPPDEYNILVLPPSGSSYFISSLVRSTEEKPLVPGPVLNSILYPIFWVLAALTTTGEDSEVPPEA